MHVSQVENNRDRKTFIELPYQLYRDDPRWVPPLRSEMAGQFNRKKNPFLEHCESVLFLLWENKKPVGRIAAFIDHLAVEAWGEAVGLFGYYECPANAAASQLLLESAQDWLTERGMQFMRGPWSFVSQEWGSVVEGFEPAPVVMSPYNPPYYNEHYEDFGLEKVKDLLVYLIDARRGYQIPERILTLTDKVANRYKVFTVPLDMQNLEKETEMLISLSNDSLIRNWGYSPVTDAEVTAMVNDLKRIIHPKAVIFAKDEAGKPVGFAIAIPDINILLKGLDGRLFPFGWLKLLRGLPKLTNYRMFALGVIPEYHGKGIDCLLYRALYDSIFSPSMRLEINYVLEDNDPMNNALLKLNATLLRRYRVFQREIGQSVSAQKFSI
jgi:GNAT superfamily N-acetyltransferase